jgi:hypothetical protein
MNRPLTALFAALEALLVAGIGIGLPLVPLTLLWAYQYGLQVDWVVFWRGSVDAWLLGHGADVRFMLDPLVAASVGFEGAGESFPVTIAALGFGLLTLLLAQRAGRRIAETPHRLVGIGTALIVFFGISLGVTLSALHPLARPSIWQGALLPTLVFALGLGIGSEIARARLRGQRTQEKESAVTRLIDRVPADIRLVAGQVLRGGTVAVALVMAAAAVATTVLIATSYGSIIALYEGIHAGVLGGVTLTLGQLAFIPNLVVWAASWLVGPGFALGTGSSVSPLGTSLGPVPAVPMFGALPAGDLAFGFLGLLVPVLAGLLAGLMVRSRLGDRSTLELVGIGAGIGVFGGALLGALAAASAGALGPGRLVDVGPNPWLVAAFAALEFGVPAFLGLVSVRAREFVTTAREASGEQ